MTEENVVEQVVKQFYDNARDEIKDSKAAESLFVLSVVLLCLTSPIVVEEKGSDLKKYCSFLLDRMDDFAAEVIPTNDANYPIHEKAIQILKMLMMDIKASVDVCENKSEITYN